MAERTESEVIAELMDRTNARQLIELRPSPHAHMAIVPERAKIEVIEASAPRVAHRWWFDRPCDLADYVQRWNVPFYDLYSIKTAPVTADVEYGFLAIINGASPGFPQEQYEDHIARCRLVIETRFKAWSDISGKWMTQERLAEFLRVRHVDVVAPPEGFSGTSPTGLDLNQMAEQFHITRRMKFGKDVDLVGGQANFTYTNQNDTEKAVRFYPTFFIGVPVFHGGSTMRMRIDMRYRIEEAALHFLIEIQEQELVEETAFEIAEAELFARVYSENERARAEGRSTPTRLRGWPEINGRSAHI